MNSRNLRYIAFGVALAVLSSHSQAATFVKGPYAVVFQEDPHDCIISGLRFWKGPYGVDKAFAEVVWDVVAEVTQVKSAR